MLWVNCVLTSHNHPLIVDSVKRVCATINRGWIMGMDYQAKQQTLSTLSTLPYTNPAIISGFRFLSVKHIR